MTAERITVKRYARRKKGRMFSVVTVDHEEKARTKSFHSEEDAQAYAQVLQLEVATDGPRALALPYTLRQEALLSAKLLYPLGVTLLEAVRAYVQTKQQNEKSCTVNEMIEQFLLDKEAGDVSAGHLRTTRLQLERFAQSFGKKTIGLLSVEEIQDWLNNMQVKVITKIGYRRALNALFGFAFRRKYTATNPIQDIRLGKPKEEPIEIFTVEETEALLKNAEGEILAFIALGAFSGLRSSEIGRLDWKDIRWEQGTIEIAGAIAKTGQRRYAILSKNLEAWLRPIAKASGPILSMTDQKAFYRRIKMVAKRAGVKWKHNALRHSYASYRTAVLQDVGKVAWEMGNSPRIIFRHYRELVPLTAAEAFWNIFPTNGFKALEAAA